jgi:3-methyladenine DNA glycosylase Tag
LGFLVVRTFDEIYAIALGRRVNLVDKLGSMNAPKSKAELAAIPDDRWLSGMARCVFNAGFNWNVVTNMWPGFEEVFEGFDVGRCAMLNDDDLGRLVSDRRIVRHGQNIRAVQKNAAFINELYTEHGGAGAFFAGWPPEDLIGLLTLMKARGGRLGGNTGRNVLRRMGVDSFLLTRDVTTRLMAEGIVDKIPTSQRDLRATQEAFNLWREQSGRTLTEISRVLAYSVG